MSFSSNLFIMLFTPGHLYLGQTVSMGSHDCYLLVSHHVGISILASVCTGFVCFCSEILPQAGFSHILRSFSFNCSREPYADPYYDYEMEALWRGGQYENFRVQYTEAPPLPYHYAVSTPPTPHHHHLLLFLIEPKAVLMTVVALYGSLFRSSPVHSYNIRPHESYYLFPVWVNGIVPFYSGLVDGSCRPPRPRHSQAAPFGPCQTSGV